MDTKSKQPRFVKGEDNGEIFLSTMRWFANDKIMPYRADARVRDTWLRNLAQSEAHLAGVINTVTSIDKNRGWTLVGGRNQVIKYTQTMHDWEVAPGLKGWRPGMAHASQSFWGTDIGAVVELGREGKGGPLRKLYSVDPCRCLLTPSVKTPLKYYPKQGNVVKFAEDDYIRVVSEPSTDEGMNGLGFCAVSRAAELTQIMMAIVEHDEEQLGAKAPRGLLLLNGITNQQWEAAMEARDADLEGKDLDYFSSVAVLASSNAVIDAKLLALSQLPAGFNMKEWMDIMMYGYALCFAYDASEFYPVQFGAMGRGTETEIQHEKAIGKGRMDFVLGFQEQLQQNLPDSLQFMFEQRDEKGELLHAQVDQAWATFVKTMIDAKVFNRDQSLFLLAKQGVIPKSWSPDSDEMATDIEDADSEPVVNPDIVEPVATKVPQILKRMQREILMGSSRVLQAIEYFPDEPLVQYSYPENMVVVMYERCDDLLRRTLW